MPDDLNRLYFRSTAWTREFWTRPEFPNLAMPEVPLYVLRNSFTFSGSARS